MSYLKKALFCIILILLCGPAIQKELKIIKEKPLQGAFVELPIPTFDQLTVVSWLRGQFQTDFSERLNTHIGFRPTMVRIYNQIRFDLFNLSNADGVIVGKNGELFEEDYIKANIGDFFVGDEVWKSKAQKIKEIQDTLLSIGKNFLVVLEPGKGSFFPELYPKPYNIDNKKKSNYDSFISYLTDYKINTLDLNHYFCSIRNEVPYRLFPKGGTHWSYYGAAIAADTLISYLQNISEKEIPDMWIERIDVRDTLRHPDGDIWLAMNLLTKAPTTDLAYPVICFDKNIKAQANALFVGDSFFFNWMSDSIAFKAFDKCDFWYYNNFVWNKYAAELGQVHERDFRNEIMSNDLIIITITERFFQNFAWGFDEQLHDMFFQITDDELTRYENDIRTSNTHFNKVYLASKAKSISLSEAIHEEAEEILSINKSLNINRFSSKYDSIQRIVQNIRNTPEWLNNVKQKAKSKGISLEEMIRLDAIWIYENP